RSRSIRRQEPARQPRAGSVAPQRQDGQRRHHRRPSDLDEGDSDDLAQQGAISCDVPQAPKRAAVFFSHLGVGIAGTSRATSTNATRNEPASMSTTAAGPISATNSPPIAGPAKLAVSFTEPSKPPTRVSRVSSPAGPEG